MRLLLDTHFVLWVANDEQSLRAEEAQLLGGDAILLVSAVSLWELRIKWKRLIRDGVVDAELTPADVLNFWITIGVQIVDLTGNQAVAELAYDIPHQDPFDRLLLVQANLAGARLLTRDAALAGHPQVYSTA